LRITFWGVRGSVPTPGPDTVTVGGNTSCVEVRAGSALLVFDGGTGLRLLGKQLAREMPFTAHLFFSHVHWDHIQGFPFFDPAFVPGNTIHLYGGNTVSRTLEQTLAGQMENPNFPVHLTAMGARMIFHDIDETTEVQVDGATITAAPGHHPNGAWAYRVDLDGSACVYATDTEHYADVDRNLVTLAKGANVLIYDAQYTPEEYEGTAGRGGPKIGWGHSTFEEGVKLANAAGVKTLVLYHHDPMQTDADVAEKERRAKALFENCVAAREGLVLEI
jgi:phosphoribosyl 1,2-cyclic phosphodiesterase